MAWQVEGKYFENCSCEVACPCTVTSFYSPADYDRCKALLAFHVDSGEVEGTDVSDLNVAVILDAPKVMLEGDWKVGLFMDARASEAQAEKLVGVFSGAMGGPMGNLAPLVGEFLGVEVASIEFAEENGRHRVKVGDAVDLEVEDVISPVDGVVPQIVGIAHPANSTLTVAHARTSRISGHGIDFSAEGKSAFSAPFSWTG